MGRLLWTSQDVSLGRASEVAATRHLGGLVLMPRDPALGPHFPVNAVFTHNINTQNQDAAYDIPAHLYDKVDAYVAASAMVALNDGLWNLAQLNNLDLLSDEHPHGWQHIFASSTFVSHRATGKLLTQTSMQEAYCLVLRGLGERTGIPAKKSAAGASSKRKTTKRGCPCTTEKGYALRTGYIFKQCNQHIVSVKTVAAGLFADERQLGLGEYLVSCFMPWYEAELSISSLALAQRCKELEHETGRKALLQVLDALDANASANSPTTSPCLRHRDVPPGDLVLFLIGRQFSLAEWFRSVRLSPRRRVVSCGSPTRTRHETRTRPSFASPSEYLQN